jgi:two-component system, OmpR family, sensor histidine kinase VicK
MNEPCTQLTGLSLAMPSGGHLWRSFWRKKTARGWRTNCARPQVGLASGPHETAWRSRERGRRSRARSSAARELDAAAVCRGRRRDSISDCERAGRDRPARVEQALLSSETRYREMVENSLGFVFTCSMEGRLTSLNAFTAETLGYRPKTWWGAW